MKSFLHRVLVTGLVAILVISTTNTKAQAFSANQSAILPQSQIYDHLIIRVQYQDQMDLNDLSSQVDVWEINHAEGSLIAMVTLAQYQKLLSAGYKIEVDEKRTIEINATRIVDPNQLTGIPSYPCYRTVAETETAIQNLAITYPDLVEVIDIGNSWDKSMPDGPAGYDIWALKITNRSLHSIKPVFFLMAEIHAREYVTTETAMRFAEYLVQNYNIDPDITWLLDYYEIHIVPLTNPDGRIFAQAGQLWRKNTDNDDGCSTSYGTDLNRNSSFHWNEGGSSGDACAETYHGPSNNSEPETQAIQSYTTSIFQDQRGQGDEIPAPADTTGEFITLHSYSELVLWPYGFRFSSAPNGTQLQTLGRKLAFFNDYTPDQSSVGIYPTSGTTDDWAYGEFGVAAYTIEMGTAFFQDCSSFENTIYPTNLAALLYAFKAARRPYMEPSGPDSLNVTVSPAGVTTSQAISLTATLNDQRYNNSNGAEPTQNIKDAEYYIDTLPWVAGAVAHPMSVVDGAWDEKIEDVSALIDLTGLSRGRHIVYVRGQDTANNWGAPSAAFFYIVDPAIDPILEGYVRDATDNAPLSSTVKAWIFQTTSDPTSGYYQMAVISDTYNLFVSAPGYIDKTITNLELADYQTVRQDIYLMPACYVLFDNVENGNLGWTTNNPWAITTETSHSPTHSWTESPGTPYANNRNISLTSPLLNLNGYNAVTLSFWQTYITEAGYDFGHIEYSTTGGSTWSEIASYSGNHPSWENVKLSIPALDGHNNSKIRFRFTSDISLVADGWHIDDIQLSGTSSDCFTPLAPTAEFTSTSPVLEGEAVQFHDLSLGTPPLIYAWNFGDGVGISSDSNPSYTYANAGEYTVTLSLTNSLGNDSISHLVNVNSLICIPLTSITLTTPMTNTHYLGVDVPFQVDLFPEEVSKPYTYTINYGDNTPQFSSTSSFDPFSFTHTFEETGTYTVTFTAWNCDVFSPITESLQLTVHPAPVNYRGYLPILTKAGSQVTHFANILNLSWLPALLIASWLWLRKETRFQL